MAITLSCFYAISLRDRDLLSFDVDVAYSPRHFFATSMLVYVGNRYYVLFSIRTDRPMMFPCWLSVRSERGLMCPSRCSVGGGGPWPILP